MQTRAMIVYITCMHDLNVLNIPTLSKFLISASGIITPRACARGKAIGFVCLSVVVVVVRLSSRKSPDLEF